MAGMNRWWRRELRRMERLRRRRIEELERRRAARRQKVLARRPPAGARPSLRAWLRRPYKPEDVILLVAATWLLRAALTAALGGPAALADPRRQALILLGQHAGMVLLVLAYLRGIAREAVGWLGPPGGRPAPAVWLAPVAGGLLGLAEHGLLRGLGAPATWLPLPPVAPAAGPAAAAAVWVGAPLAEELFYRRWLIRLFLHTGMRAPAAVVFAALLSGLAHPTPAGVALGWLTGLAYGAVYVRTGSALAAVWMHAAHNGAAAWAAGRW